MSSEHVARSRSFIITIFDRDMNQRSVFEAPGAIAAPFANRLLREVLPERMETVLEPNYVLAPLCSHGDPLNRAPIPAGPTGLNGQRYLPEEHPPPRLTLKPDAHFTHFLVRVEEFQTEIYQGEYGVDDIFLALAEFLVRHQIEKGKLRPDEGPFHYIVEPSAKYVGALRADLFPPEAYQVEGVFRLPQLAEDRKRIEFHKVPPPPLPVRDPASYGQTRIYGRNEGGRGGNENGVVMIRADVDRALREGLTLSGKVEEGGYLIGSPFRLPGSPENEGDEGFKWLVEITDVVKAEGAWGRPGLLLFTGDSWSSINRRRDRDYPGRKIVSWFHTHLFEADAGFGLSGFDQELHRSFLTELWHVAVLLNVNVKGERTVRCYQRGPDGDLIECRYEVFDPLEDAS